MPYRTLSTIALVSGYMMTAAPVPAQDGPTYALADGRSVAPLDAFRECDICPEMIALPTGTFLMGARRGESRNPFDVYGKNATGRIRGPDEINIIPNEHPRHRVEIDIPFAMARNELTHAEWMACVDDGGCRHVPDHRVLTSTGYKALGPDHPVINVSYLDALEYVAWLNTRTGIDQYRLPTEAEWEYAARAGTQTRYAQGEDLTPGQANFSRAATENVRKVEMPHLTDRQRPVPVDDLDAANPWGLRHMSGNVKEVTLSCWSDEHLGLSSASAYLRRALSQKGCRRVSKGGAFNGAMDAVRLASRNRPLETRRTNRTGFRVFREMSIAQLY